VFKSWLDYAAFERAIMHRTRYVRDAEANQFLRNVLASAKRRIETVPPGFVWRAQLGHCLEPVPQNAKLIGNVESPFPPERMKPLPDRAREGRANAKGIPCLYVASHKETAIAEVRPWIGSFVSVARMDIHRKLRVINCTTHDTSSMVYIGREPPPSKREEAVWSDIDRAFAQPVSVDDDHAAYAPTQVIAELFKMHGFDGIAYRSSLGLGHNMALFDLNIASVAACTLVEIKSVKLVSCQCAAAYCVRQSVGHTGAHYGE
jgi:hypothetical protein